MSKKVYVASRFGSKSHAKLIHDLRHEGHVALDFRDTGITDDEAWGVWKSERDWISAMGNRKQVDRAYGAVMGMVKSADVVVLAQPAGASAHFEMGFAQALGKRTAALLGMGDDFKPELMYRGSRLFLNSDLLMAWIKSL